MQRQNILAYSGGPNEQLGRAYLKFKFIKRKNYYYNRPEKGPTEEYPLLYSLVGNASNPFKGRHRSDQPIPCLTPSNVLPFYVTAETESVSLR